MPTCEQRPESKAAIYEGVLEDLLDLTGEEPAWVPGEELPEGVEPEYVPFLLAMKLRQKYWSPMVSDVRAVVQAVFDCHRTPLDW